MTKGTSLPTPGSRAARRLVKNKRLPMQTIVLRALYATGVISMALVAPNAMRLLVRLDHPKINRKKFYENIMHTLWRLKRRGLITIEETDKKQRVRITQKGETEIQKILVKNYQIPAPVLWDGKWRILIFDVREGRRRTRAALRLLLTCAGFVRLQDSVWVYPYPCDEFITLVRAHLESGINEVRLVVAETIESDKILRKHFGLS